MYENPLTHASVLVFYILVFSYVQSKTLNWYCSQRNVNVGNLNIRKVVTIQFQCLYRNLESPFYLSDNVVKIEFKSNVCHNHTKTNISKANSNVLALSIRCNTHILIASYQKYNENLVPHQFSCHISRTLIS